MSSLSVIPNPYGAKIYNVSVGKSLPQWLSEKKKKSLRYDEDYRRRVELIQDFEFPTASQKLKVTPNKEFIVASGVYPPQIRVYEVGQLSMKFERHVDFEIVDFEILSEDYSKLALLRADRTIEFHAKYGKHYTVRIPKHGRDILYDYSSCDLFVCGASSEIYRLNLEIGQFLQPFETQLSQSGWNVLDQNPLHYNLLCAGSDDGIVQCWDTRMRTKIVSKDIVSDLIAKTLEDFNDKDVGIESLKFDIDGLTLGVGTSTGHCLLYDLRAPHPFLVKDHQYGLPIKQIHFHHGGVGSSEDALGLTDIHMDSVGSTGSGKLVLTADSKVMKLWNRDNNGKIHASLECPCDINDVCVFDSSGLLLVAGEQPKMMAYFIPSLGPAPKWCSFLDNLTEELEEDKQTLYDDYKFVTRDELNRLGLGKLIGTQYLKAYMHGFFIDMKLYKKFKSIMDPFEYEEYRKSKVAEKIAQQAETRIGVKKQMPKVNAKLAARLLQSSEKNRSAAAKNKKVAANLLADDRFKDLFERKDFQIDESDEKYKFYHPKEQKITNEDIEEHFEKVDAEEDEDKQNQNQTKVDSDDELTIRSQIRSQQPTKLKKPMFYEVKTGHEGAISKATSAPELRLTEDKKLPFSKRIALGETQKKDDETIVKGAFGGMQMTFVPNSEKKKRKLDQEKLEHWKEQAGKRRGIQSLNLPKVKVPVYKRRQ